MGEGYVCVTLQATPNVRTGDSKPSNIFTHIMSGDSSIVCLAIDWL